MTPEERAEAALRHLPIMATAREAAVVFVARAIREAEDDVRRDVMREQRVVLFRDTDVTSVSTATALDEARDRPAPPSWARGAPTTTAAVDEAEARGAAKATERIAAWLEKPRATRIAPKWVAAAIRAGKHEEAP
jgi:hypothetical protein